MNIYQLTVNSYEWILMFVYYKGICCHSLIFQFILRKGLPHNPTPLLALAIFSSCINNWERILIQRFSQIEFYVRWQIGPPVSSGLKMKTAGSSDTLVLYTKLHATVSQKIATLVIYFHVLRYFLHKFISLIFTYPRFELKMIVL